MTAPPRTVSLPTPHPGRSNLVAAALPAAARLIGVLRTWVREETSTVGTAASAARAAFGSPSTSTTFRVPRHRASGPSMEAVS